MLIGFTLVASVSIRFALKTKLLLIEKIYKSEKYATIAAYKQKDKHLFAGSEELNR
jgi:hypothetical protein